MSGDAGHIAEPTDAKSRSAQPTTGGENASGSALSDRSRAEAENASANLEDRNIAVAVPIRAAQRNRRVAATVLAGGFAYRIFLWLLPFGLVVGGALGLSNADSTEDAVSKGGLPGAVTNAVGDAARSAQSASWWLFLVGVPLLLWAGLSGGKATVLIHSLVWDDPPPKLKPLKTSLAFTGTILAFMTAIGLTWWLRDNWPGYLAPIITFAPLGVLWLWVSLQLPHRDAPWKALVPGALVIAIGFQVLHEAIGHFLVPKLEKSTSLYGSLGATTTLLFFMYMLGILVVSAAVLNASLYEELTLRRDETKADSSAG